MKIVYKMFSFLAIIRIFSIITLGLALPSGQSTNAASVSPSSSSAAASLPVLASVPASGSAAESGPEPASVAASVPAIQPSKTCPSVDTLYDIYKGRLSQYQKEYEATDKDCLTKDDNKRSPKKKLNARSGNLYDAFKKKLDRFNDALNVDITIDNNSGKRETSSVANDDTFSGIIPQFPTSSSELSDEYHYPINRDSRGFFSYFSKKSNEDKKDNLDKKYNVPDYANKAMKPLIDSLSSTMSGNPGSIYDRYHKQLNQWTGDTKFSNPLKRNERDSVAIKDEPFFIWQNEDTNKKSDLFDSYDIESFINQCRAEGYRNYKPKISKREARYNRNNRKMDTYQEKSPNSLSIYPIVYELDGNIIKLSPGEKEILRLYAKKLNTTALELARKLVKLDPRILESKLLAAQSKIPKYQTNAPNLEDFSLHVLKSISQKQHGSGRRMINIPLLRNRTILISNAVQRYKSDEPLNNIH